MEKPIEDLLTALKSEVLGEAFFRSAYYAGFLSKYKNKLKVLWQLEAQTKRRILAYFYTNKIEVPKLSCLAIKGAIIGVFYAVTPDHIVLNKILKETEYYLEIFRRLESQATDKDRELFEYIVAHEVAIQKFAEIELANCDRNSIELIEALLNN